MTVSAVVANDGNGALARYEDPVAARDAAGTTWVRVTEATDEEAVGIAEVFDLHPLAIDDLRGEGRPKTEVFPDYTFVLFETARLTTEETTFAEEVRTDSVGLFVGDGWLVTVSTVPSEPIDRVWRAVTNGGARPLWRGADFLACRVIDTIVDGYFEELDELEAGVERVEDRVLDAPDPETIEAINEIRRDLLSFRRSVWPARGAVGALARGDPPHV
jgi:magnesium transporter